MKDSEKRLLVLAFGLLAVIGGLVLAQKLRTWQRALERRELSLAAEREESAALLAEAAEWKARGEWLAANQPVTGDIQQADNELLETLINKAQETGLSVVNKQFQEQVKNDYFQQCGVTLTVKGDLASVFRWIYANLSPKQFRVVPYLKITPDKDDATKVVCAVQFWRWYQPPSAKAT